MDLEQKYKEAYASLEEVVKNRVDNQYFTAMGYTSNLDLLCDFNIEEMNHLLEKYMPDAQLHKMEKVSVIRSIEDMLSTIVYFCAHGIGGEVDVENMEIIKESFDYSNGMGGTAVQAAMAIAEVGCPSLVHLTDDSKEVCTILKSPFIYSVSTEGKLVHTDRITQTNEQEIHYIIQFKKGDKICLGNQEIEIPCSNRLILTKITVNETVPFSKQYFEWIENNASKVRSNVLSSFNALSDIDILKEHLECVREHVYKYKKNNPEGIVFFEDAHYHNDVIKKTCLEKIYSVVDVVSLNEEELEYTLKNMYNYNVDIDNIISCIEGAKFIQKKFGVKKGIIVHTKDYSMYVGDDLKTDVEKGLMYGNMLATAKANNGLYGTMEQIEEVLKFDMSAKGVKNYQEVKNSQYSSEVVIVPSKYIDKPKYTIGLGDSFVGGVQICF